MKSVQIPSKPETPIENQKTVSFPIQDKLELLRSNIQEIEKYELVTTNQYLETIEIVQEILEEISNYLYSKNY